MNVAGFVRTVLAKPLVIGLLVLVGLGAGAVGWKSAATHYESAGAVLVIPPGAGNTDAGQNPFANLGGGAPQLAHVVATAAQAPEARVRVAATGASPAYTMSTLAGDSSSFSQLSPQITFVVSGPDAETARRGANVLIDYMRDKLRSMQAEAGVVSGTYADLRVSVTPAPGTELPATSARDAASYAMAAVFLVTIMLLVGVSAAQLIRGRSKPGQGEPADDAAADVPAAAEPAASAASPAVTEPDDGERISPIDGLGRPPRPRRITPPPPPSRPQRIIQPDWIAYEEPLPEPDGIDQPVPARSRRSPQQVRWARPANRDDAARPKV